jgi:hypothetical protein
MNTYHRSALAALLAGLGAFGIYAGSLLNAIALGGTLGYVAIIPGVVCVGLSAITVLRLGASSEDLQFARVLRYACLPPFVLGGYFVLGALLDPGAINGLASGVALTVGGLAAITWPEIWHAWNRRH